MRARSSFLPGSSEFTRPFPVVGKPGGILVRQLPIKFPLVQGRSLDFWISTLSRKKKKVKCSKRSFRSLENVTLDCNRAQRGARVLSCFCLKCTCMKFWSSLAIFRQSVRTQSVWSCNIVFTAPLFKALESTVCRQTLEPKSGSQQRDSLDKWRERLNWR